MLTDIVVYQMHLIDYVTSLHDMPSLFVLAFYNDWEDRKTYTDTETLSTCCKKIPIRAFALFP